MVEHYVLSLVYVNNPVNCWYLDVSQERVQSIIGILQIRQQWYDIEEYRNQAPKKVSCGGSGF